MRTSRYASSRQKACQNCSAAKARCDRRASRCTRCTQRGLRCSYPQDNSPAKTAGQSNTTNDVVEPQSPVSVSDSLAAGLGSTMSAHSSAGYSSLASAVGIMASGPLPNTPANAPSSPHTVGVSPRDWSRDAQRNLSESLDGLRFSDLDLICPINVDEITTRWMNPYIPDPGQKVKNYPANVTSFISRVLKSYTAVATRGNGTLPFIHPAQMKQHLSHSPLATCLSLTRMCQDPLPGSENTAAGIIQREMDQLTELHKTFDHMSLLATFQAYLIYTMVLFFRLSQARHNGLRQAMINLQELAHASSRQGLVCAADQKRARPSWEEWIVTETKRRTLYVMYLFDSILSAHEGLPTYLGTELEGLPAPASKSLWQAKTRSDWERAYNIHLAEWTERSLSIDELWPVPEGFTESETATRQMRIDRWLEDVDEFGTMLFAVVSCTHGI